MRVILLRDVSKLGRKHEVKTVPDGYARNFLLARGLAVAANDALIAKVQREVDARRAQEEREHTALRTLLGTLTNGITLTKKGDAQGHLFAHVHTTDIAAALEQKGVSVPAEHIHIPQPIKKEGEHLVLLKSGGEEIPLRIIITTEQ